MPAILTALRNARLSKGMTQKDLGKRVGLPQSHVSKIESGGVDPQLSSLIEMARALEMELVLVPRKQLNAIAAMTEAGSPPAPAYRLKDGE